MAENSEDDDIDYNNVPWENVDYDQIHTKSAYQIAKQSVLEQTQQPKSTDRYLANLRHNNDNFRKTGLLTTKNGFDMGLDNEDQSLADCELTKTMEGRNKTNRLAVNLDQKK